MKKIVQALVVLLAGAAVLGVSSTTASANSQYSAKRSNSVRLIWRKSMGRHAFKATTGARYSRHLAVRYGNNAATSNVTWYTDAHEKFYKKAQVHNAIYYHVKSADGTLQGWIWRGYLKAIKNKNVVTVTNAADTDPTVDSAAMCRAMFPNATYDSKLTWAADAFFTIDDSADVNDLRNQTAMSQHVAAYTPFKTMKYIDFNSKNPNSLKSIDAALTAAGYDAKTRATYQGWSVGGSVVGLDETLEGVNPGEGMIYLIQK